MPFEGMHNAQFMGLINALRTGDPTVDMMAAFLVPFLVQKTMTEVPKGLQKAIRYLMGKKKTPLRKFRRNIVYRTTQSTQNGVRMASDEDSFNMYLLRAIQLYVHKHCKLHELDDAHLDLTLFDTSRVSQNGRNGRMTVTNANGSNNNNSTVDMLQTCSLVEKPLENTWLDVGKHGGGDVEIMICDSIVQGGGNQQHSRGGDPQEGGGQGGGGDSKASTRSLEVKLQSTNSVDCLHAFVHNAFDWYINEIRKSENKDRYMLDTQPMGYPRNGSTPQYVAYKLGDEKTFETLFNRKCHELLRVVDHFEKKTGKYAIKGYPHKLGLLLTGVPGTGKTSLIKALAHLTGRHIVNINLSHISTNGDLRKIFFNKNYQIIGSNQQLMRLDFNQVIFVLEDVDASAKEVVMNREMLAELEAVNPPEIAKPDSKQEGPLPTQLQMLRPGHRQSAPTGLDKLNLSGLLNVLDGVVETPGRMVIMTSNHPEMLDPALIRPGRIDKILELGYMDEPSDVCAMLEHYYPEHGPLAKEERANVHKCLQQDKIKITPAQVEQLAMEKDDLADFLECLGRHGKEDKKAMPRIPDSFVIRTADSKTATASTTETGHQQQRQEEIQCQEMNTFSSTGCEYYGDDYGDDYYSDDYMEGDY